MKTLKRLLYIACLCLIVAACKGDDDGANDNGTNTQNDGATFTATIDNTDFSGDLFALATITTFNENTLFRLQASDENDRSIVIVINGFDGLGTYSLSSQNTVDNSASYTERDGDNPDDSTTWSAPYEESGFVGSVTISEITDVMVTGIFNFEGKEENGTTFRDVTDGRFNVRFQ